jgi:hypothetical protein
VPLNLVINSAQSIRHANGHYEAIQNKNLPGSSPACTVSRESANDAMTDRAPLLETPPHYFPEDFTPNEAPYVRWHFAGVPPRSMRPSGGWTSRRSVNRALQLSLDDLRHSCTGELSDESRSHSSES